ncbi:MAG TPA: methyl-accepting chemotaxis protein [Candidatus Paceibacterota bacterium]|nr:methyl-accepting chemotaxis protein [Candidatus Paceibacterota bacterium]HSA01634.1 methyl-accepting chemotaxis protein [Candidatus Paceibacterota bacterium]
MNLRNRILVPTLGLIILVTLALSATSYFMARNALETSVEESMAGTCAASLRQIETWIDGQRDNLSVLAGQQNTVKSLAAGADGDKAKKECSSDFARMKSLCGYYEDIHLIDNKGLARASSNPDSIDKLDVSERQYFKDAMTGKYSVSEVLASRTTGNPIVVLALPIQVDQRTTGTLIGVLDLNWFSSRFIANIKVLRTGYIFVHDEKGVFIAHPQKDLILKTKLADFSWSGPIQQQDQGAFHYTYEGMGKAGVFAKSQALKWGVVATVPLQEADAAARQLAGISTILGCIAAVAGFLLVFLIARGIARPVHAVAEGLASGSAQTSSAAGQVAAASQSLAEGASEQAASLEETSSSLEELASMTKRNAESAGNAKHLAQEARQAAETGMSNTQHMTQAMDQVNQSSQDMRQAMEAIKQSSDDIAKIIKTIDEIAFQTNILALNAAVEAARAGDAGMGFAVVADEVRNLAQRSAQAAKETAGKIETAISKSENGVRVSLQVTQNLQSIVGNARDVEQNLRDIVDKVRQVDSMVAEVAAASEEQQRGVGQINVAVSQMDKVTQSTAATAEESASAAEELNAQAEAMSEAVRDLMSLVEGQAKKDSASASAKIPAKPSPTKATKSVLITSRTQTKDPASGNGNGNGHATKHKGNEESLGMPALPPARETKSATGGFTDF